MNNNNTSKIRTRYAPSPTGYQHIGGIRTAIFNYLLSRNLNGEFILRIEDTDSKRFVEGTEQYIIDTLKWLDISYSEGPDIGGKFAPYRQSDRTAIYQEYAKHLIDSGNAYYAFDSIDSLENARTEEESKGGALFYNYLQRHNFINSLTLSVEEVERRLVNGEPYVIRLKLPTDTYINFDDLLRGEMQVHTSELEDRVLIKSDGIPTYHLAHIVDDVTMEITHVIRGEEWLPSAPAHHYIYEALGLKATKPMYAHLPLVLNPDGDGKLSKRKLKDANIPIFPKSWVNTEGNVVKGMREEGFLPDAVLNILVLLGWHPRNNQEIFSRTELISIFDMSDIQKSGAKFDYSKAKWINAEHLKKANTQYLFDQYCGLYGKEQKDNERLLATIEYVKNRISLLNEIDDFSFLFLENKPIDLIGNSFNKAKLESVLAILSSIEIWGREDLKVAIKGMKDIYNDDLKIMYHQIRFLLSGKEVGIDLLECFIILGKSLTLTRLKSGLA